MMDMIDTHDREWMTDEGRLNEKKGWGRDADGCGEDPVGTMKIDAAGVWAILNEKGDFSEVPRTN